MGMREDFFKIKTGEDFNAFTKKYKDKDIKLDKEMIEYINNFFKKTGPSSDPDYDSSVYLSRKRS